MQNPKFEYRKSKQFQISNDQNSKRFDICALNLDIVSNLALRASKLSQE